MGSESMYKVIEHLETLRIRSGTLGFVWIGSCHRINDISETWCSVRHKVRVKWSPKCLCKGRRGLPSVALQPLLIRTLDSIKMAPEQRFPLDFKTQKSKSSIFLSKVYFEGDAGTNVTFPIQLIL